MMGKWIGAMLVIAGCGGVGFSISSSHRKTEAELRQLLDILLYMESELSFRLTPLPDLCWMAGMTHKNTIGLIFLQLARELECQISPDVNTCIGKVLSQTELPQAVQERLLKLGTSLGRFDLDGQLKGLKQVQEDCRRELETMGRNREERLRSYQTLGLCAGAAIAILFV